MTEAGTPSLNRHVPREEAQARIEAARKIAEDSIPEAAAHGLLKDDYAAFVVLKKAMHRIVKILDGGQS